MDLQQESHARKNLLTGEWVLVSPHRTARPWQGQVEKPDKDSAARFDAACYLCPGNERAGGATNPDYRGPFVFDNDFSALSKEGGPDLKSADLFEVRREHGHCRVVCYSERHDQRLATMSQAEAEAALNMLFSEFDILDNEQSIKYVQLFENRGAMMGCSNPHPHAQIWATSEIPTEPAKELAMQKRYWASHKTRLLSDYLAAELEQQQRIVYENSHFVLLVPFWAVWPFETMLLPRRAIAAPQELLADEISALAEILQCTLAIYDGLFAVPAPYSMGFHPRPSDGEEHPEWLFHLHFYPPMLRSASIRKHLVGFEMLAMPQRDITPESAAAKLRACLDDLG